MPNVAEFMLDRLSERGIKRMDDKASTQRV